MKKLLKNAISQFGYKVQGTRYAPRHLLDSTYLRPLELKDIICRRMFEIGQELTFIQVGAFDGVTKDPLHAYVSKHSWSGVLVEPQPGPARRLRELYRDNDRIVVLQSAIDTAPGQRSLFTVESDDIPAWAGGMASFQRDHILKHAYLIPGLEKMIQEITIDCITFRDVFTHLHSDHVDVLQIDAEGADGLILSLFPFDRVRPPIVHWEVKNLTKAQREECFDRLSGFGYRFAPSGDEDMMALLA
jgi:FkbM family methyltransferase